MATGITVRNDSDIPRRELDPSGSLGWHPNSGNAIARGFWIDTAHLLSGFNGDGNGHVLLSVNMPRYLQWHKYLGNGEWDPEGTQGWHPNSGTRIGRDW